MRKNMRKPKILVWDLEFKGSENYKKELKIFPGYIICFCCKELGVSKITTYSALTHPGKDIMDDRALVRAIGDHLRDADLHVFQYGTKVDFRFIQTKLLQYGLKPLPEPPCMVDTCSVARAKLSLVSNSLRELARFFKLAEQKMDITHEQWYKAFIGDKETLKLVAKRCASDVRLTEEVYFKIRSLITNHPNLSLIRGSLTGCPNCGTEGRMRSSGIRATTRKIYRRLSCKKCGSWVQEPYKENKENKENKEELRRG